MAKRTRDPRQQEAARIWQTTWWLSFCWNHAALRSKVALVNSPYPCLFPCPSSCLPSPPSPFPSASQWFPRASCKHGGFQGLFQFIFNTTLVLCFFLEGLPQRSLTDQNRLRSKSEISALATRSSSATKPARKPALDCAATLHVHHDTAT